MDVDAEGIFVSSAPEDEATFSIITDNYTGYTLGVSADNDDGTLVNESNDSLTSIDSSLAADSFNSSENNGKWGFRPSKYQDSDTNEIIDNTGTDAVYLPSPTTDAVILDVTESANNEANTYSFGLAARASYQNSAGQYTKTLVLMATGNPVNFTIEFNSDGLDEITNFPENQSSASVETSITLPATAPSRPHYTFSGWCLGAVSHDNGTDSCAGSVFLAGSEIGLDQTNVNTLQLTAMWKIDSFTQTVQVRYENADGTWGNYSVVSTTPVNYGSSYSWSTSQISGFNSTAYQATSINSYTVTQAETKSVSIYRKTFTVTKQYRLQTTTGTYPSSYTSGGTQSVRYGGSYTYTISATTSHQQASKSSGTVTANTTISLDVPRKTFTCSRQYRLETATGSWGSYTADGSITAYYGGSCSYSKTVTDYRGGSSNSSAGTASASNVTANQTLSVSLYRNNFALTVNRNTTYISSVSGAGTYRWGQSVSISATAANLGEFSGWSQTAGTTGSFGNTGSASTTFTMPKSAATVYANGVVLSMQNFTLAKCTTAGVTIRDNRDGNQYLVKKLSDGKCWMQDNLRIINGVSMTSANTNIASGRTYSLPGSAFQDSNTTAYIQKGTINNTATVYGSGSNKRGVYYNYCAASAGTYCASSGSGNASYDICPKGWRLPTGGPSGEFQALYNKYGNKSNFYSAFSNILSGDYMSGQYWGVGSYGNFWSSTRANATEMYDLYSPSDGNPEPANQYKRGDGFSVRCVLK